MRRVTGRRIVHALDPRINAYPRLATASLGHGTPALVVGARYARITLEGSRLQSLGSLFLTRTSSPVDEVHASVVATLCVHLERKYVRRS
jgi:hypothetical protein